MTGELTILVDGQTQYEGDFSKLFIERDIYGQLTLEAQTPRTEPEWLR